MKTPGYTHLFKSSINDQREDVLHKFIHNNSKTRFMKRRTQANSRSIDHDNSFSFSHLNQVKLNKGKKFLLEEERNTEIERSNRILHNKLARQARRSQPHSLKASQINSINAMQKEKKKQKSRSKPTKLKTNPTILPSLEIEYDTRKVSRVQSKDKNKDKMTLFMGHSLIDEVQFKIKIIIAQGMYYLIAQNQHTKIVLEIPQQQYWQLHYRQFQQNPCNIFKYLKIQKGQINFRVKNSKKKKKRRRDEQIQTERQINGQFGAIPKGIERYQEQVEYTSKNQKLPKI